MREPPAILTAPARSPKIGLMLPSGERMMGGGTARWHDLLALARRAEALGFDSLWVVDHVQYEFGGTRDIGMWECWSLLSALAAATELGSLVTSTAYRSLVLLANVADTVDEISGGRVTLGVGACWVESEFRALGVPYDQRVGRFAEALEIVTALLCDRAVDRDGRWHTAREATLRPPGPRRQGPPVMVGTAAHGPRMLALTGRNADIWNIGFRTRPGTLETALAAMDTACHAVGRDPATLRRFASVQVNVAGHGLPGETWIADTRVGNTLHRLARGAGGGVAGLRRPRHRARPGLARPQHHRRHRDARPRSRSPRHPPDSSCQSVVVSPASALRQGGPARD